MNDQIFREKVRERLISVKENILSNIESLKLRIEPISPDTSIGRVTRMDAIVNRSILETNLVKEQDRLKRINEALNRSNDEDFGYCRKCEERIPFERLMVVPEAIICVKCMNEAGL